MSELQVKIAQELAIDQRINTAEEVQIEEFCEGGIGVQANPSDINVGTSGHGRKVVKRVYKFKSWHENALDVIEQYNKDCNEEDNEDWFTYSILKNRSTSLIRS